MWTSKKEDYSDGIDNYDYIGNVRFQVEEDHLKTVYNEAPVINGLTDIEESENPMNDILTGISIRMIMMEILIILKLCL